MAAATCCLASATTAHPILVRHSHSRRLAETTSPRLSDATAFPRFNAKLEFITSSAGTTHPVVWVPSHGAVPVCSKADGPQDERGRPQGININTYYIRTPGPQSEPITTPAQWAPLTLLRGFGAPQDFFMA